MLVNETHEIISYVISRLRKIYHTSANKTSPLQKKQKPQLCRIPSLPCSKQIKRLKLSSCSVNHNFRRVTKRNQARVSLYPTHSLRNMQQSHLFASPFTLADSARIIKTQQQRQQQNAAVQPHKKKCWHFANVFSTSRSFVRVKIITVVARVNKKHKIHAAFKRNMLESIHPHKKKDPLLLLRLSHSRQIPRSRRGEFREQAYNC